jgi:hypothetical protein
MMTGHGGTETSVVSSVFLVGMFFVSSWLVEVKSLGVRLYAYMPRIRVTVPTRAIATM